MVCVLNNLKLKVKIKWNYEHIKISIFSIVDRIFLIVLSQYTPYGQIYKNLSHIAFNALFFLNKMLTRILTLIF